MSWLSRLFGRAPDEASSNQVAVEAAVRRPIEEARKRGIATAKRLGAAQDEDIDVFVAPVERQ